MSKGIKIAIDGPAAAGKSTIAKRIAEKLDFTYIDTGAMYRALTHKALVNDINITSDHELTSLLEQTELRLQPSPTGQIVFIDGLDCTEEIRSPQVTANVSEVAAHENVRHLMVDKQRKLALATGVVMDGRDIGTAVLPDAELKVFMTASVEERAIRRHLEDEKRGIHTPVEQLKAQIAERDRADSERIVSPLKKAEDAVVIDTTSMTIDEVVEEIIGLAEKRMKK
ncbi:cytidylate kinase [Sporosarcina sp. NCCP-2222]|uniref:(d)CMP kinase n=1 Tax=Sporosarcina sp. NCCP-2222 TaxID=2935073 RepID=UPI002086E914|nr:(d)CMP kinase [Sporosarcina sp. NCCP-2222]GKV55450.1 cytidylate kinase [Sporosarcina sp. NCCP-2222]